MATTSLTDANAKVRNAGVACGLWPDRRGDVLRRSRLRTWTLVAAAVASVILGAPGAARDAQVDAELASAIRARVVSHPVTKGSEWRGLDSLALNRLYETGAYAPLWSERGGRLGPRALDALRMLNDARADGLDPADYASVALTRLAGALNATRSPTVQDVATFEVELSANVLRYMRDIHLGRIDPQTIGFKLTVPAEPHDFVLLLRSALAERRVANLQVQLAPPLVQYRALRSMLAQYRKLAADADPQPLFFPATAVHPEGPYAELARLSRLLAASGDFPAAVATPNEDATYAGPIVDAVKRFQVRHGLEADGVLGKATQAALRVPLVRRVRQIEFALERLRWLPDLGDKRFIALNIPMFHLWVWDAIPPGGEPLFGMRAIVGRAVRTQTPIFVEDMQYVIFRPYWNVPRSILRQEILPMLSRDPDYLRREDMEMVNGAGDDAQPVPPTAENIALLRAGSLRLRQRPGPKNALGMIKFVFPNSEDVYLHSTPAHALFSRTRRDFSHGCVRVEDPIALAEWVLKDRPEWSRDQIVAAMSGTSSQRVHLHRPVQVVLFYVTAVVMPEDGTIHFAEDIYGHDTILDRALGRQRPPS